MDRAGGRRRSQLSQHVKAMRFIPLALLSAALVLPLTGHAQTGGVPPSKAGPQTQRARTLSMISLSGRYLAARVAEQDHDYETGAEQLDLALAQAPGDPTLLYDAFRLRVYAGRLDAAAQLAPQVLTSKPGDGFANLVLTLQDIKKGDYKAAEQQLGRISADNQLGPLRDYVVAWLRAGQKDFVGARGVLAKLSKATNDRGEAPTLIIDAQIDEMAGDRAAAEAKYRKAVELDPSGMRVVTTAADGLRRLGKADDARA
ncbi:MAG TPA: hypothetical protein VLL30_28325, partial [Reyranella sp.]|nr:hypothetical protein [Reyranella sp.]